MSSLNVYLEVGIRRIADVDSRESVFSVPPPPGRRFVFTLQMHEPTAARAAQAAYLRFCRYAVERAP